MTRAATRNRPSVSSSAEWSHDPSRTATTGGGRALEVRGPGQSGQRRNHGDLGSDGRVPAAQGRLSALQLSVCRWGQ